MSSYDEVYEEIQDQDLTEFMTTFEASTDPALWAKLVNEEAKELLEAFANVLKESIDLSYVTTGLDLVDKSEEFSAGVDMELLEKTATLQKVVLILFGGEVIKDAWNAVHASNMSKLGEDGKPVRREDGKILKGPNYKPADMVAILDKHIFNK